MKIFQIPFDSGNLVSKGSKSAPAVLCNNVKSTVINVDNDDIEKTQKNIYDTAVKEKRFIAIGGDHSVSYSLILAFMKNNPNGAVLYFDSHADCDVYLKPPSYEDLINVLFKDKVLSNRNFAYVGLTKIWENEIKLIESKKIRCFEINDIKKIADFAGERKLYVSIDIDVLNVKGTGHPDGKAGFEDLMKVLELIKKQIVSADIVEINPELNNDAVEAGKKLLKFLSD